MQKQKEGVNTLTIQMVLANVNEFLYSNILLALLIGTGIYFTIRTRFVQFRLLKEGISLLMEKAHTEDGVSSFQALMISTASRVGTGKYRWCGYRVSSWRRRLYLLDVGNGFDRWGECFCGIDLSTGI